MKQENTTLDKGKHATSAQEIHELHLYVAGTTLKSIRAIENVKAICEKHLNGKYELEIIDIYQQPVLAVVEQVVVAPTLVKKFPLPIRKLVGDMSKTAHVISGLNIEVKEDVSQCFFMSL